MNRLNGTSTGRSVVCPSSCTPPPKQLQREGGVTVRVLFGNGLSGVTANKTLLLSKATDRPESMHKEMELSVILK